MLYESIASRSESVPALGPDGFARNDDLHPPVLLPAHGRIVAGHRISGSHTHGSDSAGVQSLLHQERPHVAEILIWSFAITHTGIIKHAYDAIYFCANAYTTLGMGSLDVGLHWRNISPIIGISGLFTFAWTTSALVDMVASYSRLLEQLEIEREHEMHMRFALRKEQWDVLKAERGEALSEKEKTRTRLSGLSFFQRRKIRPEERNREKEFRSTARAQIKELSQKERQNEEKLGPGTPTDAKDQEPQ